MVPREERLMAREAPLLHFMWRHLARHDGSQVVFSRATLADIREFPT
jgi:hypothetical protein